MLPDMFTWRYPVVPALAAVAGILFVLALFLRPRSLPLDAARFQAIVPAVSADAARTAAPGVTYAIDTIEADHVQHPITGAVISTREPLVLHGWAVVPTTLTPGRELLVSVDGRPGVADPSYGIPRPDVGAAINPSATSSGFGAVIPTAQLRSGPHTVHLRLIAADGHAIDLPTAVTFELR